MLARLRQHGFDMQATARAFGWDRSTVTQRLKGLGFRALVESGGSGVSGFVQLTQLPHGGTLIMVNAKGLTPGTEYAWLDLDLALEDLLSSEAS